MVDIPQQFITAASETKGGAPSAWLREDHVEQRHPIWREEDGQMMEAGVRGRKLPKENKRYNLSSLTVLPVSKSAKAAYKPASNLLR